jgi:hypothetical protein
LDFSMSPRSTACRRKRSGEITKLGCLCVRFSL